MIELSIDIDRVETKQSKFRKKKYLINFKLSFAINNIKKERILEDK